MALGESFPCPKFPLAYQSGKGFPMTVVILKHTPRGPDTLGVAVHRPVVAQQPSAHPAKTLGLFFVLTLH